jgi:hypothetical protein
MYSDAEALKSRLDLEKKYKGERTYNNLFLQDNSLVGTSTKLEVINTNENKSAFKFNVLENFTSNFEYDFLDSFREDSESKVINVMIGNYSDKNTIMNKMININTMYNGKYIIGNKQGINIMDMDELLKLVRTQSANYYSDLLLDLFDQYKKIGVNITSNEEEDIENNIRKVNKFLLGFNNIEEFNQYIYNNFDNSVRITEELHYSTYFKDGKNVIGLNQTIVDYYRIFTNETLFQEFVEDQEKSLITKLTQEKGELLFDETELDKLERSNLRPDEDVPKNRINNLLKSLGISPQNYKTFLEKQDSIVVGHKIQSKSGMINPLLKRWM